MDQQVALGVILRKDMLLNFDKRRIKKVLGFNAYFSYIAINVWFHISFDFK